MAMGNYLNLKTGLVEKLSLRKERYGFFADKPNGDYLCWINEKAFSLYYKKFN